MRINQAGIEQRISGVSKQLEEASKALEQLSKLAEEDVIADLSAEVVKLLGLLLEGIENLGGSTTRRAPPSSHRTNRSTRMSVSPSGFLWKPISDSDGKLAVLLPSGMTGRVSGVSILSPDSRLIERGRGAGVGNGGREHFRFTRPGGSFPAGSMVEITFQTGEKQRIRIDQTGRRVEGR